MIFAIDPLSAPGFASSHAPRRLHRFCCCPRRCPSRHRLSRRRVLHHLAHHLAHHTWPVIGGSALCVTTSLLSSKHGLPERNSNFSSAARGWQHVAPFTAREIHLIAGGGAQKLLENHAGAESMRFVVLASKIKVRRAWDTLDVEGQPGVASGCSPGAWGCRSWCVWPQPPVPMAAASDCAHHRRRTTAWTRTRSGGRAACSACTHRARTPWPLRRRRARAPTLTVTPIA